VSLTPDRSDLDRFLDSRAADLAAIPVRITIIVVVAFVVRFLLHRAIARLVERAAAGSVPVVLRPLSDKARATVIESSPLLSERRRQRTATVGSVLRSVASFAVFTIAFTMVLGELGLELGPILASAGILGVAVGFGAQNLIKDFLTGIFMILEDQYGVGDAIDAGEASGIVEAVGLRTTRLRSVDGTVWHIRNGEIIRVGNMSQGWSRALLDVAVVHDTDVDAATATIKRVADEVWHDEEFGQLVLEEPEVWGVESVGIEGMAIRLVVKTAPLEQWKVARELRRRIKAAFDEAGIEVPSLQAAAWARAEAASGPAGAPTS
jgi:small-conductance mechanosensitive channel